MPNGMVDHFLVAGESVVGRMFEYVWIGESTVDVQLQSVHEGESVERAWYGIDYSRS
jgi:hypothetical protein